MNKKLISIILVLLMLVSCILTTSCKKSNTDVPADSTEEAEEENGSGLNISSDLIPKADMPDENEENLTPEERFEKGILKTTLVQSADGTYTKQPITAAYVFKAGDDFTCVAITLDENTAVPDYIFHVENNKLLKADLSSPKISGVETEFYFIKNSVRTLLRDYSDKENNKYGLQFILDYDGYMYGFTKQSEYEIPFDDSSDLATIRKNINDSFDRDVNWYLGTDSFETIRYADVAVTENVEAYLEKEVGFTFEAIPQLETQEDTTGYEKRTVDTPTE